jgi:hypothetical protein
LIASLRPSTGRHGWLHHVLVAACCHALCAGRRLPVTRCLGERTIGRSFHSSELVEPVHASAVGHWAAWWNGVLSQTSARRRHGIIQQT